MSKQFGDNGSKVKVVDAVRKWCASMLSHGHTSKFAAMANLRIAWLPTSPGVPEKTTERFVQTHKTDVATTLSSSPTLKATDWDIASESGKTTIIMKLVSQLNSQRWLIMLINPWRSYAVFASATIGLVKGAKLSLAGPKKGRLLFKTSQV